MGCCASKSEVLKPIKSNQQSFNMSSYQNQKSVNAAPKYPKGKALLLKRIKQ
jgi:hypothetical protein